MAHAYKVSYPGPGKGTMKSIPEKIGRGWRGIATYMVLGGEDTGFSAVETLNELGHSVPHHLHLLRARERLQHQVPCDQREPTHD